MGFLGGVFWWLVVRNYREGVELGCFGFNSGQNPEGDGGRGQ